MKERIAIIGGYRSPMTKAGGVMKNIPAQDLGSIIVKELIAKLNFDVNLIDDAIIGNVAQPANAANIARVIILKAGLPESVPAVTVHRNCASGMESFTTAAAKILNGESEIVLVGGVESMSNIPLIYNKKMTNFFGNLFKAKTFQDKIKTFLSFRLNFLKPIIGLTEGLTDPISGLIMGCTAENIARDFNISRETQDKFAALSHNKAEIATKNNIFKDEIIPVFNGNVKDAKMIETDDGIRNGQTIEALAKLKPYFEKVTGTVTVGNSSQVTDGAAFAILMKESKAKELGYTHENGLIGYIKDFAYAGLDPSRMGMGPVFATAKLFEKTKTDFSEIDLFEINEAFAAQVIGCVEAFASNEYCQKHFGRDAFGKIDMEKLNVNGGAIALGHPVGMSGARIIISTLRELRRRSKNRGLATLCVGGGQGGSVLLEVS